MVCACALAFALRPCASLGMGLETIVHLLAKSSFLKNNAVFWPLLHCAVRHALHEKMIHLSHSRFLRGTSYNPFTSQWAWSWGSGVNYALAARKPV